MKKKINKQKICWGIGKFAGGNLDVMRDNEKDFQKLLNRKQKPPKGFKPFCKVNGIQVYVKEIKTKKQCQK